MAKLASTRWTVSFGTLFTHMVAVTARISIKSAMKRSRIISAPSLDGSDPARTETDNRKFPTLNLAMSASRDAKKKRSTSPVSDIDTAFVDSLTCLTPDGRLEKRTLTWCLCWLIHRTARKDASLGRIFHAIP